MSAEKEMWQAVVHRALIDATAKEPMPKDTAEEKNKADDWIRKGGGNFRFVCDLAGYDADFIRECYISGRLDGERLRSEVAE